MNTKLEKAVRILKMYAVLSSMMLIVLLFTAFTSNNNQRFEEIDVERINIIEKDGKLKMVISNQERQHPGIVNGKVIERKYARPPGIIFFNQLGDEMGGLVNGDNGPNGHFGSLTWDKVRGDQTIGFRHLEGGNGKYEIGLQLWQQPNIPVDEMIAKRDSVRNIENEAARQAGMKHLRDHDLLTTRRLFLGKLRSDEAILEMQDKKGNRRITMMVEADGSPKLLFYDEAGEVMHSIPE